MSRILTTGRRAVLLAMIAIVVGLPTPAGAADLLTSPSTLQATLAAAQPGDRILLRSGSYGAFVTIARSGTSAAPITIGPAPGESPVVTGRFEVTGRHIVITRLTFRGGTTANRDDSLIYINGGSDVEISHNELSGSALSAIGVWDRPGDRVRIVGNWIHDIGRDEWSHGVYYAKGSDGLIAGNRIERISGHGIQAYPNPQRLHITGNEIADAGRDGKACLIVSSDAQGGLPLTSGVIVEGNYAHGCPIYGFRTDWQDPLGGPYGSGNLFRANWATGNGDGDFGAGEPLGSTPSTTGAAWTGNVVGAPPGGVLVPPSAVGPGAP